MSRVLGADISHHQGNVNFQTMASKGIEFLFTKATEGNYRQDVRHLEYHQGAGSVGFLRSPYHFYIDNIDAVEQAQYFYNFAQDGELPPMLDVEDHYGIGLTSNKIQACAWEIEKKFGRRPIIYTSSYFWDSVTTGNKDWAKNYMLMVAQYPWRNWWDGLLERTRTMQPEIPETWLGWAFWQTGDRYPGNQWGVSSATIDLDWFNGSKTELQALSNVIKPPPPEEVPQSPPPADGIPVIPALPKIMPIEENMVIRSAPRYSWLTLTRASLPAKTKTPAISTRSTPDGLMVQIGYRAWIFQEFRGKVFCKWV